MRIRMFNGQPRSAAEWFAARLDGSDARLEQRFQAWLSESSAHAEEYALCEITWEVSRGPAERVPQPRESVPRRAALSRWATAVSLCTALGVAVVWLWPSNATQTWSTAAGELRTLVLEDGSRVTLNTRTRLTARFLKHARSIALLDGEAFFEVTKDPSRPFTVQTRLGTARALGTRFNVYTDSDRVVVSTEEGRVLVRGLADTPAVNVDPGMQAEVRSGSNGATLSPVNVGAVLNWLTRRLDVENQSLSWVLHEFNRYTARPLRADDSTIADLRVSAVLRAGDMDALRATLKGAFGLEIEPRGSEWVVIDPKGRVSTP